MCFRRKSIVSILVLWSLDILHCQASSKQGNPETDNSHHAHSHFAVETTVFLDSFAQKRLTERNIDFSDYVTTLFQRVNEILNQLEPPVSLKVKALVFTKAEEEERYSALSGNQLLGSATIRKLAGYVKQVWTTQNNKSSPDMTLLLSGLKMRKKPSGPPISGIATLASACGSHNAMIVAYEGNEQHSIMTTAHEIGHALGSSHDGDRRSKNCRSSDQYLMGPADKGNRKPTFSSCSKAAIKKFLESAKASCLFQESTPQEEKKDG